MDDLTKDVRLLRRNLAKGFTSQDAIAKLLADLPDVADRAEWVDPEADLDDDDDGDDD
ncbi:MAG: hypothetical protein H6745_10395 [Deltaproteobacteria bacterium]|nr:hypothetical protein [Deltaproteobacteria bacterium]